MVEHGLRRLVITFTAILAAMLELIDATIVNVSLPNIQGELGATLSETVWVIAAYAVANAIVVPTAGWFASIFGRRRYYIGSILLFTLASFLCGQSDSIWELSWWRFVQGVGGGALLTTSQAILVESYPPSQLGRATALFGLAAVIGPTVGPGLGGYLTDYYNWSWSFYINIPLGLIAAFFAFLLVREPEEKLPSKQLDWQGLLILIFGIGSLQLMLEWGYDEDWFESSHIAALAFLGVMSLLVFIWWELQVKNPVVNLRVLKNRSTSLGTIMTFMQGMALYGSAILYPLFAQRLLGFSAYQTGITFVVGGLAAFVGIRLSAFLIKKGVPPNFIASFGFVLIALFCYSMSLKTLQDGEGVLLDQSFLWPLMVRGAGVSLVFVPLTMIALSDLRGADIPQGAGLTNMARQLGGSLVGALIATFINTRVLSHRSNLLENVSPFDEATRQRLEGLVQGFIEKGSSLPEAEKRAVAILDSIVNRQSFHLSFIDAFQYAALTFLACAALIFFLGKVKKRAPIPTKNHH